LGRNNLWGDLPFFVGLLERLAQKPDLRALILSDNHDLGSDFWQKPQILEALAQTSIQVLHLAYTSLGNESIQAFLQKAPQTQLTDLYVARNEGQWITREFISSYTQNPPSVTNRDGKPFKIHFE
jgi:hypothetical protein